MITTELIKIIEDRHTLSDCLFFIMQALETGVKPPVLPTLNDNYDEDMVQRIVDLIVEQRRNATQKA